VGWTASEPKNGSAPSGDTTEYIFTSHLATATDGANNATLQYFFTTFASDRLITTGMLEGHPSCYLHARLQNADCFMRTESNYSFTVTPALLKFSLNISSWAWNSACVFLAFFFPFRSWVLTSLSQVEQAAVDAQDFSLVCALHPVG
jgi:hypothetical protein